MSETLARRLDSINAKVALLKQLHEQLLSRIDEKEARINELTMLTAQRDKEIDRLRQDTEYLRVVHTITPSREEVERSRAFLSGLMRDIDKCIADLDD